jgi:hypothetical protein
MRGAESGPIAIPPARFGSRWSAANDEIAAIIYAEEQKHCGAQPAAGSDGPNREPLGELDAAMWAGDRERAIACWKPMPG